MDSFSFSLSLDIEKLKKRRELNSVNEIMIALVIQLFIECESKLNREKACRNTTKLDQLTDTHFK